MEDLILKCSKQTNPNKDPYISFPKTEYWEWLSKFEDGKELVLTISDKRSLSKNACLHGWVNIIAEEMGETFEVAKWYIVTTNFGYTLTEIDGIEIKIPISTSKLSNKKFGEGLTKTYIWALETFNVTLPNKDIIDQFLK